uniref:SDR family NAD(P)-dependent oxidoreductase n=1 Tax=Flavobacterium sp. Root935 TaxID=1736610 RepID=UPI000A8B601B|nr:SDR family NAD(P)-dependent oxidoreductase [Flavobacterium sp. Root935]
MNKTWFITGSSRGLGRNLTEAVLKSGDKVVATARDIDQLNDLKALYKDQIFPVALDVTNYEQVYSAVKTAAEHFGRIDVLVNNAGFGIIGAAEAYTSEQVRSQLETIYMPQLRLRVPSFLICANRVQEGFYKSVLLADALVIQA